mgnify:CR=1 FL=1
MGPPSAPRKLLEKIIVRAVSLATSFASCHVIPRNVPSTSMQNMLGHLYGADVEAVGVAMNALLTRDCGQVWALTPLNAKAGQTG